MKLDLTITVTAILGIAAIISPIATAIINNRYQLKLKNLNFNKNTLKKQLITSGLFSKTICATLADVSIIQTERR